MLNDFLIPILAHTPKWVYALLAALVVLGWMQSRPRQASLGRLLIAPVALSALSLHGVLSGLGSNWVALACWPVAAGLTAWGLLRQPDPAGTRFDVATAKFSIAGSWAPMALFLGIFLIKYAVGVTLAFHPEWAQWAAFALPVSLVNGVISGLFIARGLRWWRMRREALSHS